MSRSTRKSRRSTIVPRHHRFETLERRVMLCAFHLDHEPVIELRPDLIGVDYMGPEAGGLADIVWTNRANTTTGGIFDTDGFGGVFGANANVARAVVDAVIAEYERMIISFNYGDGSTSFNLNVSMGGGTGRGGAASTNTTLGGKPKSGSLTLQTGTDGQGAGWFIDPTPNEHSEFVGTITNAFAGDAQAGSPALNLGDFYTVAAAEVAHCLGLGTNSTLWNNRNTNTNITDNAEGGGVGTFYVFNGSSIQHLMTSNNGGPGGTSFPRAIHTAGSAANINFSGTNWRGAEDAGNAVYEFGRRYLVPDVLGLMFKDAYNYTVRASNTRDTFYSVLNTTTGQLTVRGGTDLSNDVITVTRSGTMIDVSVDVGNDVPGTGALPGVGNLPAFTSSYLASDVSSIVINAADGNDTITINGIQSNTPITINAGAGNDTINIAQASGNLDTIASNIIVNGGTGADTLTLFDTNNTFGDTYTITNNSIGRNSFSTLTFSGLTSIFVRSGSGSSTFNVLSTPAGATTAIFAGAGNDTFNVGNGNTVAGLAGSLVLHGEAGTDTLNYNDSASGGAIDYTLNGGAISRTGVFGVSFGTMENVILNAGSGGNTITVAAITSTVGVTVNGGGGNDNLVVGSIGGLGNIAGTLLYNGGDGTDTLTINDTAATGNFTHTITQNSYTRTNFGGISFGTIESIVLSGGNGGNTYNIDPTPVSLTASVTINAGSGNDAFRITPTAQNAAFIGGTLNLNGGGGTDSLTLFDGNSTASMPYAISTSSVVRGVQTMNYSSVESMTIHGTGGTNTFSVSSLSANATLNGNAGNDSLILGGTAQNLDGITGSVVFNGGTGTDTIELRDQQNTRNDTYTIQSTSFARPSFGGLTWGTSESLTVEGGSGNNTFQLLAASIPVTLNGNGGNDHFAIGGSSQAIVGTNFAANIVVNGGDGTDTVTIFDNNGAGNHTYTLQAGTFDKTDFSFLTYSGIENFTLHANNSNNTVNVESLSPGMSYVINGNGGNDTFNLAQPSGQLGNLPSPVTINGGAGVDQLLLFDASNSGGSTYTITNNVVTRGGFGGLTYGNGNESLFLSAGAGADTFNIESVNIPVTVFGGNGDDHFIVGGGDAAGNINSLARILGGGGNDKLTVNDATTSAANNYTFDENGFSMTGSPNISYDSIEQFVVDGSQGANTFTVRELAANTPVTLNGNGGNDTFNLGSTANRINTIASPVSINGGAGSDRLFVNDQGDAGSFGFTVSSTSISRSGAGTIAYSNLGEITLNAGNAAGGGNKTHDILSLGSPDLFLNAGIGSDTIRVSPTTGLLGSSGGDMWIDGQGGNDTLVFNDGMNAANESYFVSSQFVENSAGRIFEYSNIENLQVNGGPGASEFNLSSLFSTTALTLNGNGGADTFNLGNAANGVASLAGPMTLNGGTGADTINVNDTANAGTAGFTVTPTTFTRTGMGTATYSGMEQLTINSGGGSTKVHTISGTAAGTPVRLNPGPARDIIDVTETSPTGPVTIGASTGGDSVDINLDNTGQAHVIFDESITLGGLRLGNGGFATVRSGGSNVLRSFGLTIAAGSRLDLNDNPMIIDYAVGTPLNTVRNALTSGYNAGAWNGNGIMSSVAAATPDYALGYAEASAIFSSFPATFAGQSVDNTTVLIRYTRYGDANLDGQVNLADFNRLAANFGGSGGWSEGNFNYDSAINLADFNLLAANFGQSAAQTAGRGNGETLPPIEALVFGDEPIDVTR